VQTFRICLAFAAAAVFAAAQVERPLVPVPADTLEMAAGGVQTVETPEQRAAFTILLNRAHDQLNLHGKDNVPFDLKVSFNATGPLINQGSGEMEEVWMSGLQWRWTAKMGGYSQVRVGSTGALAYDESPVDMMPFPVHMLRCALFNPMQGAPGRESLRAVSGSLSGGGNVACVLMTPAANPVSRSPGRFWTEREYCVSPDSGLLQIASVAPGYYVAYDYTNGVRFHNQAIPGKITITENGRVVLEARIESIADAGSPNPALFAASPQMLAHGAAAIMSGPDRFAHIRPAPKGDADALIQPTIVHALIDESGNVREAEALQSTSVSAAALDLVKRSKFPQAAAKGTAPLQREAFINVQFQPMALRLGRAQ
jgi:hypothetical protein